MFISPPRKRYALLPVLAFAICSNSLAATTLTSQSFDSSILPKDWSIGAQNGGTVSVSTNTSLNLAGSTGSLKGTYPTPTGGVYVWGTYNIASLQTRDLYIEFDAKMPSTSKHGLKFLKIFGSNINGGGVANTTFALDYTGADNGSMRQVSFGDGTSTGNDTQNVINFDGTNPQWIGRSYGKATVSTPQKSRWASSNWGTSWHHFKFHVKFNSGTSASTEVADGEYYVEIDGKVYVDAKGLLNRHYLNGPIERIELFGWSQAGSQPFEIWYDNVKISTGGFSSSTPSTTTSAPAAPSSVKVVPVN